MQSRNNRTAEELATQHEQQKDAQWGRAEELETRNKEEMQRAPALTNHVDAPRGRQVKVGIDKIKLDMHRLKG